jgi:8-oxo-dGTP diphosphatase
MTTHSREDFTGVKIALIHNDKVLMIHRDDKPGLRFAGLWDFPGGGREGNESPYECAAREVDEELGLQLNEDQIIWHSAHPAMHDPKLTALFMVAKLTQDEIDAVKFGDEGQSWKMRDIGEFMNANDVIEALKGRLQGYLDSLR